MSLVTTPMRVRGGLPVMALSLREDPAATPVAGWIRGLLAS